MRESSEKCIWEDAESPLDARIGSLSFLGTANAGRRAEGSSQSAGGQKATPVARRSSLLKKR